MYIISQTDDRCVFSEIRMISVRYTDKSDRQYLSRFFLSKSIKIKSRNIDAKPPRTFISAYCPKE